MNSKFNGGFIKTIVIISMLPLVPVFLLSLAPAGLSLVGVIAYLTVSPFRRGVNSVFSGIGRLIGGFFSGIFKLIGGAFIGVFRLLGMILKGFGFSLSWLAGMKTPPSRFMG
jgi:predicted membrane protein